MAEDAERILLNGRLYDVYDCIDDGMYVSDIDHNVDDVFIEYSEIDFTRGDKMFKIVEMSVNDYKESE